MLTQYNLPAVAYILTKLYRCEGKVVLKVLTFHARLGLEDLIDHLV